MAALAGCSVATAVKAVRELSEAGYLTVKHTKYHSGKLGRTVYGKNTYTVDLALLKKGYTILDRAVLEQELTDSALIVLCAIIVCAGNSSRPGTPPANGRCSGGGSPPPPAPPAAGTAAWPR